MTDAGKRTQHIERIYSNVMVDSLEMDQQRDDAQNGIIAGVIIRGGKCFDDFTPMMYGNRGQDDQALISRQVGMHIACLISEPCLTPVDLSTAVEEAQAILERLHECTKVASEVYRSLRYGDQE